MVSSSSATQQPPRLFASCEDMFHLSPASYRVDSKGGPVLRWKLLTMMGAWFTYNSGMKPSDMGI